MFSSSDNLISISLAPSPAPERASVADLPRGLLLTQRTGMSGPLVLPVLRVLRALQARVCRQWPGLRCRLGWSPPLVASPCSPVLSAVQPPSPLCGLGGL